jgi:hypothetical protein
MERTRFQQEGLKWLIEAELLQDPQAINNIKFNILMVSPSIKEAELLIYRENKTMLVLLELTWFGRKFRKQRIFPEVQDILTQLLPSFRFRITENPKIMEMAVERVKQALTGGKNENTSNTGDSDVQRSTLSGNVAEAATSGEANTGTSESSEADQKEQSESPERVFDVSRSDDPQPE